MRKIKLYCILIFLAISCTVQTHPVKKVGEMPNVVVTPENYIVPNKIIFIPVPVKEKESIVLEKYDVVQDLDTAALTVWFERIHNHISIMDDYRVMEVIEKMNEFHEKNEALVERILEIVKEKERIEKTINITKNMQSDIPTIMLMVLLILMLVLNIYFTYKISYEQNEIKRIRKISDKNEGA